MQRHTLTDYLDLHARLGEVVQLHAGRRPVYLMRHPDAVQHVLRDHAGTYRKGAFFEPIARLQGQGLLTSEGDLWRHQRRLMQPAFHPRQLALGSAAIVHEAQAVIHDWQAAARSGQPVNVTAWMQRLTFRVVGQVLLAMASDQLDDAALQLQKLAGPLKRGFASPGRYRLPAWLPTLQKRRFRRGVAIYHRIVQQLIEERRQRLSAAQTPAVDVLARLLLAQADATNSHLTEQQLRDEVITLIGAGAETSALALGWLWYLLAQHPEAQQQVLTEVDVVLDGRPPTLQRLSGLPYSRMVIDETLRLYPPSAVLPRQANADDVINGYPIPQEATVILSQYVTHRHADFWPLPEQFYPERFTPERVAKRHRFAYFPFGAGPRRCIGKALALMEIHLVLATIAQSYTLRLVPGRPVVPILDTTLRPRHGLWMTVHARR